MSVFVKKMKMPENCYDCSSFGLNVGLTMFDGICPFCIKIIPDYDMKTGRHPDCPLIEIPPHGNLIDRWELTETALIDPDGGRRKGERRMDDTISRQAAIDALNSLQKFSLMDSSEYLHGVGVRLKFAVQKLEQLPSAQPKIIHCRECKHWRQQTNYVGAPLSFGFCESDDMWRSLYGETCEVEHIDTEDDFYCGYAERREE